MTPWLSDDVLSSLSAHIAVLDADGTIVTVNAAWRSFAGQNGGDQSDFYVGASYLKTCETAASGGDASAVAVRDGLRDLLAGRCEHFATEYPCHSPDARRWFAVRMSRFMHQGARHFIVAHENITTWKEAEEKLKESEGTLRIVIDALPVGVWIMDNNGRIVHGNPAGQRIWAGARYVGPEEFGEYKGWWVSTGEPLAAEDWAAARAIRHGETSIDEEIRIACFDGEEKIILNSATPLRDSFGHIVGAIIVNQDITERKQAEQALQQANTLIDASNQELQRALEREQIKANTDDLTGLNNRRHFFDLSRTLYQLARRHHTPFSVLLFDIDHFKRLNDRHGHQFGDLVLKEVAAVLRASLRGSDVHGRYGGEEFVVTLPNTSPEDALIVAENLRTAIAARRVCDDAVEASITVSIGIAGCADDDTRLDQVIQRADLAMYAAKHAGRNCCRPYTPEMSADPAADGAG